MKKVLSFLLCIVILVNLSAPVFAIEAGDSTLQQSFDDIDVAAYAQEIYADLDDESRAIFDYVISGDEELLAFHKLHVDADFKGNVNEVPEKLEMVTAAIGKNPLTTLFTRLSALGLPVLLLYALKALGASLVVAFADGVLPVGDILLIVSGTSTVIILGVYWSSICTIWDDIVDAFSDAFSTISTAIKSAFTSILNQIRERVSIYPSFKIQGKKIIVNEEEYLCTLQAQYVPQGSSAKYYPALLYNNTVLVDITHPLTLAMAQTIMRCNSSRLGVWATSSVYARGLCGGNSAIADQSHNSSEGYFFHYHHPTYRKFHCWYLY